MKRCLNCMEVFDDRYGTCPVCGFTGEQDGSGSEFRKPGSVLQDRYVVGTVKVRGRTDLTYIGWDNLFARKVLIQEFFPQTIAVRAADGRIIPKQGKEKAFQENLQQFYSNRKLVIRLYDQSDILSMYSCFTDAGTAFATTQYTDALTLEDHLAERGPLKPEEAFRFLALATNAVARLHAAGVVHGDIGPQCLYMSGGGRSLVLGGYAEPCHFCGDPSQTDYGKAGSWTDVQGLALLYASLLDGKRIEDPEEAKQIIRNAKRFLGEKPFNTMLAALSSDDKERIKTAAAFLDGVFEEGTTVQIQSSAVTETTTSDLSGSTPPAKPAGRPPRTAPDGAGRRGQSGGPGRRAPSGGWGGSGLPGWMYLVIGILAGCLVAAIVLFAITRKKADSPEEAVQVEEQESSAGDTFGSGGLYIPPAGQSGENAVAPENGPEGAEDPSEGDSIAESLFQLASEAVAADEKASKEAEEAKKERAEADQKRDEAVQAAEKANADLESLQAAAAAEGDHENDASRKDQDAWNKALSDAKESAAAAESAAEQASREAVLAAEEEEKKAKAAAASKEAAERAAEEVERVRKARDRERRSREAREAEEAAQQAAAASQAAAESAAAASIAEESRRAEEASRKAAEDAARRASEEAKAARASEGPGYDATKESVKPQEETKGAAGPASEGVKSRETSPAPQETSGMVVSAPSVVQLPPETPAQTAAQTAEQTTAAVVTPQTDPVPGPPAEMAAPGNPGAQPAADPGAEYTGE